MIITFNIKADENSVRLGKFSISGLISGNNEQARQERLAKLEIEIREFKAATTIAEENLRKLETASKQEHEVNIEFKVGDLLKTKI